MKNWIYITGLFLSSVFLFSCGDSNLILMEASGEPYELVIVYERFIQKKTPVPDTVNAWFEREIRGLPQSEKMFKVYSIDEGNFGNIFKYHRNVLMITIDPKVKEKGIAKKVDSWAKGQIVVQVLARNRDEFFEVFRERKRDVEKIFVDEEMSRQTKEFAKSQSKEATKPYQDSLQISLTMPEGFYPVVATHNFVYSKHIAEKSSASGLMAKIERGVWVHTFPYNDPAVFSPKRAMELRDSLTRVNIPDAKEGAYMIVESRLPVDSTSMNFNGEFALVCKGLWRVKEGFKGGPFINITTYDRPRNRIIMADGYVFAPEFPKKVYIRQVEAILRSLKAS